MLGVVKWFNPNKGYGFVTPEGDDRDVFIHITAVQQAGLSTLNEGQKIEFELVDNKGRQAAADIKPVD